MAFKTQLEIFDMLFTFLTWLALTGVATQLSAAFTILVVVVAAAVVVVVPVAIVSCNMLALASSSLPVHLSHVFVRQLKFYMNTHTPTAMNEF